MLHLCISGALYRPLRVHVLITRNNRIRKQQKEAEQESILRTSVSAEMFRINVYSTILGKNSVKIY
jgi:hypothetical protein